MRETGYVVMGKPNCAGCEQAKALLEAKGEGYEYIDVMRSPEAQALFRERGFRSVPQIFLDGEHIPDGFNGLKEKLENS